MLEMPERLEMLERRTMLSMLEKPFEPSKHFKPLLVWHGSQDSLVVFCSCQDTIRTFVAFGVAGLTSVEVILTISAFDNFVAFLAFFDLKTLRNCFSCFQFCHRMIDAMELRWFIVAGVYKILADWSSLLGVYHFLTIIAVILPPW